MQQTDCTNPIMLAYLFSSGICTCIWVVSDEQHPSSSHRLETQLVVTLCKPAGRPSQQRAPARLAERRH